MGNIIFDIKSNPPPRVLNLSEEKKPTNRFFKVVKYPTGQISVISVPVPTFPVPSLNYSIKLLVVLNFFFFFSTHTQNCPHPALIPEDV